MASLPATDGTTTTRSPRGDEEKAREHNVRAPFPDDRERRHRHPTELSQAAQSGPPLLIFRERAAKEGEPS